MVLCICRAIDASCRSALVHLDLVHGLCSSATVTQKIHAIAEHREPIASRCWWRFQLMDRYHRFDPLGLVPLVLVEPGFMRILQPQTESGPRNYFFIFFHFVFHFFPVSYHSPIMWNVHFHFFHSPIMWKCHSHLFIVFPSCAVNIIMFILVPSRLVDSQRKTSKSKTQKLRPQPQFLWGRNSRLLQVRIRLTLVN